MPPESEAEFQFQFQNAVRQREAATLGMWVFIATEVMFFAALFTGYALYRRYFPEAFFVCSRHLDELKGTIETAVLLTSSLFMAMALHFAKFERRLLSSFALLLTALLGATFLAIHFTEYRTEYLEGSLPGRYYHLSEVTLAGASTFFTCYWFLTVLHSFHVFGGICVLLWTLWRTWHGHFKAGYHTPVEMVGLYWHFVDLVWIFLYPLLYLVAP